MKTLTDFELEGKRVLVRVDFNVPLDSKGNITDDKRIREALPTINYTLKNKGKLTLMSHLGKPDGKVVETLKMDKVAARLSKLLNKKVTKLEDCVNIILPPDNIILLENLRFHKEEELNDKNFSTKLSSYGDIYINDAFGTMHRKHASVYGVVDYFKGKAGAGFLVEKEIKIMQPILENPQKPYYLILGGSKVKDKMGVINNLYSKVTYILMGGKMSLAFIAALGLSHGKTPIDKEEITLARKLLDNDEKKDQKIKLPFDFILADRFDANAKTKTVNYENIDPDYYAVDIGPKTIKHYIDLLKDAKTVVWSGPMGVFEIKKFENGTKDILRYLATKKTTTIIGGGDTGYAAEKFRVEKKLTHISTGGTATLEFFEGKKLPGVEALEKAT